jgi:hypothetical protein
MAVVSRLFAPFTVYRNKVVRLRDMPHGVKEKLTPPADAK